MIRKFILLVAGLLLIAGEASAQLDSLVRKALDARLEEYFSVLEREGTEVQKGECDFLIETCTDSLMRQHVALSAYEHFRDSKIMGAESVAIHVFDSWFASGKVQMRSDMEMLAAKVFAEFNRQSLVGSDAPEIILYDREDSPVTLFGERKPDRVSLLYFYDTSCAVCKIQTILLRNLLQEEDFPVDMYAIYAGDDKEAWETYVLDQLTFDSQGARVIHLWDPYMEADMQRKYGVIQTPRILLVGPDGVILGRGLDAQAVSQMLHGIFDEVEMSYGSEESMALYEGLFSGGTPTKEEIADIAGYIASSTLEQGDTLMFRQMSGDMLYYLTLQSGEGYKEGLDHLIDKYILSRPDIWNSEDDTLKIVGMARMYDDLLSKSAQGTPVPDLKLPGQLLSSRRTKAGEFRLKRLGGKENYIMFVTDGCAVCAGQKEAARMLAKENRKARVLIVNVDEILASRPDLASEMFDSFDLSSLPFILSTDNKGRILRRYIIL
ncbi:MAG: thioredoxin family protein [Bacteroidales bacterium]|nr:thioredoxin family protein [Bacteroidales bacterium]